MPLNNEGLSPLNARHICLASVWSPSYAPFRRQQLVSPIVRTIRRAMPNRRQQHKVYRANVITKARGGLISDSDNIAEEIRVRTNLTASIICDGKRRLGSVTRVSDDLAITNILSDLRHYCNRRGLSYKKLDEAGCALYLEEKAYETACPTPIGYPKGVAHEQPTSRTRLKA